MDEEHLQVLGEAVRIRQRKEDLERAVGRAVRKSGKNFRFYMEIVSELRETSRARKVDLDEAAKVLLAQDENRGDEGYQ